MAQSILPITASVLTLPREQLFLLWSLLRTLFTYKECHQIALSLTPGPFLVVCFIYCLQQSIRQQQAVEILIGERVVGTKATEPGLLGRFW